MKTNDYNHKPILDMAKTPVATATATNKTTTTIATTVNVADLHPKTALVAIPTIVKIVAETVAQVDQVADLNLKTVLVAIPTIVKIVAETVAQVDPHPMIATVGRTDVVAHSTIVNVRLHLLQTMMTTSPTNYAKGVFTQPRRP